MRFRTGLGTFALSILPLVVWAQPYAFVTSVGGDAVSVLDLGQDTLQGGFSLPGLPSGSALSPDGTRLFVALTKSNSLASIDTASGAVTLAPVGASPAGVAADPFLVYVANTADDTLSVFDQASGTVAMTVPTGRAPIDVVTGDWIIYVANWEDGTVSVYSLLAGMQLVGTVVVGTFPAGLALDPAGGRLYVANLFDKTVSVVDTATLTVVATVGVSGSPRGLALDSAAGRLYVAGLDTGEIQAIDTVTNQVVMSGPSGASNPIDLLVGPNGDRLYVVHLEIGETVTVLDAATLSPLTAMVAPAVTLQIAGFASQAPPLERMPRRPYATAAAALPAWERNQAPRRTASRQGGRSPLAPLIFDNTFNPGDWALHSTGDFGVEQMPSGGSDDGYWRRTSYGMEADVDHEYLPVVYDPATQGGIGSLVVSWYHKLEGTGSASDGVLVFQDGSIYVAPVSDPIGPNWSPTGPLGLTAADFSDGQGGMPDFGPSGPPLTFGYRAHGSTFGIAHGIDQFSVDAYPTGSGYLAFRKTAATTTEKKIRATVDRLGGTQGPVSVDVYVDTLNPSCVDFFPRQLTWGNGDDSSRTVSIILDEDDCHDGVLARVHLLNPAGGATVINSMVVYFWGSNGFFISFLLGATPGELLILALPAGLLAVRRRRTASRRGL